MQILRKPLEILEIFLRTATSELSLSDLVKATGFNISTVQRIVLLLLKEGYLSQRKKRGKYSLGPKIYQFCGFIRTTMKIENVSHPLLEKLAKLTAETAFLSVKDGSEIVDIDAIYNNTDQRLQISVHKGFRGPLHCTAVGKIFLAHMTDKELERYSSSVTLISYTNNTITDFSKLKEQVLIIRQAGIAFNYEEHEIGVTGLASPIRDWKGDMVAAVGIAGPSPRLTNERMRELAPIIKDSALEISRFLGYKGE